MVAAMLGWWLFCVLFAFATLNVCWCCFCFDVGLGSVLLLI